MNLISQDIIGIIAPLDLQWSYKAKHFFTRLPM